MAHQVFISYSSIDVTMAERACAALESAGLSCWMAPRDIPPGTDYPAAIVDAVSLSVVFVLLLTEHAVASPHILSEVGHAFNDRKLIVPFRIANVAMSKDLDYFLSMAQWLEARDGVTDETLQRLVAAVKSGVRGETPVSSDRPSFVAKNGKLLALIAMVVIILGGILYWKWPRAAPGDETLKEKTKDTTAKTEDSSKTTITVHTDTKTKAETPVEHAKTWLNPVDGETYVWIPAGTFTMGCSAGDAQCRDDEKPAHPVEIEKPYWLARTETTLGAYRKYAARRKLSVPEGDAKLPVTEVTWAEAKTYCSAVGGRLPSEAEWEYAARAGTTGAYYGVVPAIAWYVENSNDTLHPVGGKKPNAFGLYDMLGNVSEWVLDRYFNKYDLTAPATGPGIEQPLAPNAYTVARGGFWDGNAETIRVSHRAGYPNDAAEQIVGFRCASDHI